MIYRIHIHFTYHNFRKEKKASMSTTPVLHFDSSKPGIMRKDLVHCKKLI